MNTVWRKIISLGLSLVMVTSSVALDAFAVSDTNSTTDMMPTTLEDTSQEQSQIRNISVLTGSSDDESAFFVSGDNSEDTDGDDDEYGIATQDDITRLEPSGSFYSQGDWATVAELNAETNGPALDDSKKPRVIVDSKNGQYVYYAAQAASGTYKKFSSGKQFTEALYGVKFHPVVQYSTRKWSASYTRLEMWVTHDNENYQLLGVRQGNQDGYADWIYDMNPAYTQSSYYFRVLLTRTNESDGFSANTEYWVAGRVLFSFTNTAGKTWTTADMGDTDVSDKDDNDDPTIDSGGGSSLTINGFDLSTSEWTNQRVTYYVDAYDTEDGYNLEYYYSRSDTPPEEDAAGWETASYDYAYSNGTYYVYVKNSRGTIAGRKIKISNIDTERPSIPTIKSEAEGQKLNKGDTLRLTATSTDSVSGINGYYWDTKNETPDPDATGWSFDDLIVTENGWYYCWAKDKAGNVSYAGEYNVQNFIEDTTGPNFSSLTANPSVWTNSAVTLTAKATDDVSGIERYVFTHSDGTKHKVHSSKTQVTKDVTTYGVWTCQVFDKFGNESRERTVNVYYDVYDPTVSLAVSTKAYTNQDVVITATARDIADDYTSSGVSGIAGYYWTRNDSSGPSSVDDGNWIDGTCIDDGNNTHTPNGTCTYTVTENGTYRCWVKDAAGNISNVAAVTISNIDKRNPDLTLTSSTSAWTQKLTITGSAVDKTNTSPSYTNSGIAGMYLSTDSKKPDLGDDRWVEGLSTWTVTEEITANATWYLWVKDNAGNITSKSITISNIDTVAPTGTLTADPAGPTNQTVTLTMDAQDLENSGKGSGASGITGYYFSQNTTPPTPGTSGWQSQKTKDVTQYGTWYCWVKDEAGNVSQRYEVEVYYDVLKPAISDITSEPATGKADGTINWVNTDVVLTATAADAQAKNGSYESGIAGYYWSQQNLAPSTVYASGWKNVGEVDNPEQQVVTENGTWYCWVKDNAGNISAVKSYEVTNIDKVTPEIVKVDVNPSNFVNTPVTITVTARDNIGVTGYYFHRGSCDKPDPNDKGWTPSNKITVTQYGYYWIYVKDAAGNVSEYVKAYVRYDKSAPKMDSYTLTPDKLTNTDVTIHVKFVDMVDGKESTDSGGIGGYYWSTDPGAIDPTASGVLNLPGWINGISDENEKEVTENDTYYVWAKDTVGNISQAYAIEVTNIDKEPPVAWIEPNPDGYTNGDVTLTAVATDNVGLAENAYSYDGGTTWVKEGSITVTENGVYSVLVRDKAGNTTYASYTVDKIDKVKPTVNITPSTDAWTNQDITLTATGADAKDGDRYCNTGVVAFYWAEKTGEDIPKHPDEADDDSVNWLEINNSDPDATPQTSKTITENGIWYCWVKDAVGNVSEPAIYEVTNIDKSESKGAFYPQVDAYTQSHEGWTNQNVTLLVNVVDEDSGLAEEPFSYDGGESWTDAYKTTVVENGTYQVQVKDKAGNITTFECEVTNIDKIKPNVKIVNTDYNESVKTITLTAKSEDKAKGNWGASGVIQYFWRLYKTEADAIAPTEETEGWIKSKEETQQNTIPEKGTWYVWVMDQAGNISEAGIIDASEIDTEAPTNLVVTTDPPQTKKTNKNVTIKATAMDNVGVSEYYISRESITPDPLSEDWTTSNQWDEIATENGIWFVWCRDAAGNVCGPVACEVSNIDRNKPTIGGVTTSPITGVTQKPLQKSNYGVSTQSGDIMTLALDAPITVAGTATTGAIVWGTAGVELTVQVNSDDVVGFYFSTDPADPTEDSEGWQESNTYIAKKYGYWYVWVIDEAGNISERFNIGIVYFDEEAPELTVTASTTEPTNQNVTLTATAIDRIINNSGASGAQYFYWSQDDTLPSDKIGANAQGWILGYTEDKETYTTTLVVEEPGTWYCWAKDLAGNISETPTKFVVDNLDKVPPVMKSLELEGTTDTWAQELKLVASADDNVKVTGYYFSLSEEPPKANTSGWQEKDTLVITRSGTWYCWAKDAAGNVSEPLSVEVTNLDTEKPTIASFTADPGEWTNQPVTLEVQARDNEQVTYFYFSQSDKTPDVGDGNWQKAEVHSSGVTDVQTAKKQVESNGTWYCWAKDAAGNISNKSKVEVRYDKVKPVVTLTRDIDDDTEGTVLLTATVVEEAQGSSGKSGIAGYYWSTSNIEPELDAEDWITEKDAINSNTNSKRINSVSTWYCWVMDYAGNVSETQSIKIDNIIAVRPEVDSITLNYTPNGRSWLNASTNPYIEVQAKYDGSNGQLTYYYYPSTETMDDVALQKIQAHITNSILEDKKISIEGLRSRSENTYYIGREGGAPDGAVTEGLDNGVLYWYVWVGDIKGNLSPGQICLVDGGENPVKYDNVAPKIRANGWKLDDYASGGKYSGLWVMDVENDGNSPIVQRRVQFGTGSVETRDITMPADNRYFYWVDWNPNEQNQIGFMDEAGNVSMVDVTYNSGTPYASVTSSYVKQLMNGMWMVSAQVTDPVNSGLMKYRYADANGNTISWSSDIEAPKNGTGSIDVWLSPAKPYLQLYTAYRADDGETNSFYVKNGGLVSSTYLIEAPQLTYVNAVTGEADNTVYVTKAATPKLISGTQELSLDGAKFTLDSETYAFLSGDYGTIFGSQEGKVKVTATLNGCSFTQEVQVQRYEEQDWNVSILENVGDDRKFTDTSMANNSKIDVGAGNWTVAVTLPYGVTLEDKDVVQYNYRLWGTESANSKLGLVLYSADGTEYDLSETDQVKDVAGVRIYNASAYYYGFTRTFRLVFKNASGSEVKVNVHLQPVTTKKLDITVPVAANIQLEQQYNSAKTSELTITNHRAYPLSVSIGNVSQMTDQSTAVKLVQSQYQFRATDDVLGIGVKLGVQLDSMGKIYYTPGATSQSAFTILQGTGSTKFQYFMEYGNNYKGFLSQNTFGYTIGYRVTVSATDVTG